MTRIAFYLPHFSAGDAEKSSLRMALEIQTRGHEVIVFADHNEGPLASAFAASFRTIALNPALPALAGPKLAQALKAEPVDALVAVTTRAIVNAALLKRVGMLKTPLIGWNYRLLSPSLNAPGAGAQIERRMIRALFPICDHLIAPSRGAAEDARAFCAPATLNAVAIYDSVAAPLWQPHSAQEHAISAQLRSPCIVAHGPLIASRDYANLLRAFQQFARVKGGSLLIIGEGQMRATLESTATGLGLGEKVVFAGHVDAPANLLALGDLYVSSAAADASGIGLMEAMASGIPIVAADCPAARDILADGRFGRLVPPGDPRALWHAMRDALAAPHDRQALRTRAGEFTIERAADAFLNLIGAGATQAKADKKAA